MHEDYLQQIWSQSRLPSPKLQLIDGTPIIVKYPGKHNTSHSGPDFKEACVEFDNLEFHGAIEIHVNGSDWYKHKHHQDRAYNNVVLHVVYNNDMQIVQNGFSIPTLELKEFIDKDHFKKSFCVKSKKNLPCKNSMDSIAPIYWSSMKTKSLIQKLDKKVSKLLEMENEEVMYRLIASAFGMGINKKAFSELSETLPWKSLEKLSPVKRRQLILVASGCAQGDFSQKLGDEHQWHFKGTRPGNFPSVRIPQFANLIATLDMRKLIELVSFDSPASSLIVSLKKVFNTKGESSLSASLVRQILINAVVPYLYFVSEKKRDERFLDRAIDLLLNLPAEKNSILRAWKENNIRAINAFDSQGLIALNRYYCSLKKCLSCEVGLKALNRSE